MNATEISITVSPTQLSDGSFVYDVLIGGLVLPAITESDAHELAEKIIAAIEQHTNEIVCIGVTGSPWVAPALPNNDPPNAMPVLARLVDQIEADGLCLKFHGYREARALVKGPLA